MIWNYKIYFSLWTETIQSEKWVITVKAKKLLSVLWNRKHIFPYPKNMGNIPLQEIKNAK